MSSNRSHRAVQRAQRRARPCGVGLAIREDQVAHLSDRDQDRLIAQVGEHLHGLLAAHVGNARPIGDLAFSVTGPHADPLQGVIHVHHLVGQFDPEALPLGCEARRLLAQGDDAAAVITDAASPLPYVVED